MTYGHMAGFSLDRSPLHIRTFNLKKYVDDDLLNSVCVWVHCLIPRYVFRLLLKSNISSRSFLRNNIDFDLLLRNNIVLEFFLKYNIVALGVPACMHF